MGGNKQIYNEIKPTNSKKNARTDQSATLDQPGNARNGLRIEDEIRNPNLNLERADEAYPRGKGEEIKQFNKLLPSIFIKGGKNDKVILFFQGNGNYIFHLIK